MPDAPTRASTPPAPRTGWWWLALALTALLGLVLLVTAGVAVSATLAAEARKKARDTPTAPPPAWATRENQNLGVPPFVSDPEGDAANVRDFFARLAAEVKNPKGIPDELIDWAELSGARPDDAIDAPFVGESDPHAFGRQVVQSEQAAWREWDWARVNVRKVGRRPDGSAVEAVGLHPARDGRLAYRRWTFTDSPDGLRLFGWEDLRTGVTSGDLAYARVAAALSPSVRRQRHWRFTQVNDVHRLIDRRKWADAERLITTLKGVRFDGELHYPVDLAEARLTMASRRANDAEWDDVLVVEILEDLIARYPHRLAAYPLLAEAHLLGEEYERVIEVCDAYLSVIDPDPDALALRGAAHSALLRADEAAADFTAALALNRHQPRAVNWQRRQADAAGKTAVAEALATAPDAAALFDALAAWAADDADWAGVVALAERYRKLRPTDPRWAMPLVESHLRAARPDDAVNVFRAAVQATPPPERAELVRRFTTAMLQHNLAERVYAAVPTEDAPVAFRLLAERYELLRGRSKVKAQGEPTKHQQAAIKSLTDLFAAHRKRHPGDPRLALHEGRLKLDSGEYDSAADALAPALAKLTPPDEVEAYTQSEYMLLLRELVLARYRGGKAADALREFRPTAEVFVLLADQFIADQDAPGLSKLVDGRKAMGGESFAEPFWRAEADRLAKRHADAARKYGEFLAAERELPHLVLQARVMRVRCLARAGDTAAAEKAVGELPADALPVAVRAAVLVKAGKPDEADGLLRGQLASQPFVGWLYADDDLGPLLRTDPAFAAFRKDFPPPAEDKPAPPR
jgi:tetratricopeptide (TPR) repeat protein